MSSPHIVSGSGGFQPPARGNLFCSLLFLFALCLPLAAWAEEETPENATQQLSSFRVSVFNKAFKSIEEDDWELELKTRIMFGYDRIRSIEDIENLDLDSFQSAGLWPMLQFGFPVSERWTFRPYQEFGGTFEFEKNNWIWSSNTAAGFEWINKLPRANLRFYPEVKYGYNLDESFNFRDDFLNVSGELSSHFPQFDIRISGKRNIENRFHFRATHYFDNPRFIDPSHQAPLEASETYEVGVTIYFEPRYYIWKIRLPGSVTVAYQFGKAFSGWIISM